VSDQQQDQPEIEATGTLEDGRISVSAKLGGATLDFSWEVDADEEGIDTLLQSSVQIGVAVVERLVAEQEADRA